MPLTVADIDRWNAQAVRDVFGAANARAAVTFDVSRQLASLSILAISGGRTAEAVSHQNAGIRQDLDAHGNEALAVARAADQAADGIEKVQSDLAALREGAAAAELAVDAVSNRVVTTTSRCRAAEWARGTAKRAELQVRLDEIVVEANAVDEELAWAVNMADGDVPIPCGGPPVGAGGLTPTQRASDENEERLRGERAKLAARIGQLHAQYDTLAVQAYLRGDHDDATMSRLHALRDQITAAEDRRSEFDAVGQALRNAPETYLTQLQIPDAPQQKVLAAVAVGNPDVSAAIAVTVPGMGSTTKDTLPGMVGEAWNLRKTAQQQLDRLGLPGSVATIAWMGYDPPSNPLNTTSPRDVWRAIFDDRAELGAGSLSSYLNQIHANNRSAHVSLFGHSYGSLTASLALQQLNARGLHPVDDAVFYGSPGLELGNTQQLGLHSGHAYVMRARDDLISELGALAPYHNWGVDPYGGMLPELSTEAGAGPDRVVRSSASGHAGYPRAVMDPGGEPALNMAGYNLAVIAAGIADLPGGDKQLMMAPTLTNPHPHPGG